MRAQRRRAGDTEIDQIGRARVVHLDVPVEAPCELRRDEGLQITLRQPPLEAAGDEQRLVAGRNPVALELVDGRRDRRPPCRFPALRRTRGARPPRLANASSGSPDSGNRKASRTAAATSAIACPGAGGRRISAPSGALSIVRREPFSSGMRGTRLVKH